MTTEQNNSEKIYKTFGVQKLRQMKDHPFQVRDDEEMRRLGQTVRFKMRFAYETNEVFIETLKPENLTNSEFKSLHFEGVCTFSPEKLGNR